MTFTAKQFHRAYRKYTNGEGIKYPKSFRQWCKTATVNNEYDSTTTGAFWLQRKDKR